MDRVAGEFSKRLASLRMLFMAKKNDNVAHLVETRAMGDGLSGVALWIDGQNSVIGNELADGVTAA